MNYCSNCGGDVETRVPEGDNRTRFVCAACGMIHYQNPRIVVGCIPAWTDQVLLCRRAIEPRRGLWTLPAGFMENGETCQQGALRETWEEGRARVRVGDLYTVFNLPHINQVYLLFRSQLLDQDFAPGEESLEVALFPEAEIPWDQLAFPVVLETLKLYFNDFAKGQFRQRCGDIVRIGDDIRRYRLSIDR
jgi:ADP-ribose pyrophosphatase YjhB (NUDIX family)